MDYSENLQSHVLRVLARQLRFSASQTAVSWYSNKMLDSAIELEVQAINLESGASDFGRLPSLLPQRGRRKRVIS